MSRNTRLNAALVCLAACLLFGASSASAGGCPAKPVAENGGKHWCYSAGAAGHVHLWKPKGFDARTAVTVVYVHGHNTGVDGCADKHYVDCAWDKHGLAAQFDASSVNALFVAVEGPVRGKKALKWTSLGGLLKSIRRKGGITPPSNVTAMAHSAGIYTVLRFIDDGRLKHVMVLDALYGDSPRRLAKWFRASKGRRLTLIGAQSRDAQTTALGTKLGCSALGDPVSSYPRPDRCVVAVDAAIGHMEVITDGRVIPSALLRAVAPAAKKAAPSKHRKKKRRH